MKKTISVLGLSFMIFATSQLDAVIAFAIAYVPNPMGGRDQIFYQVFFDNQKGIPAQIKAEDKVKAILEEIKREKKAVNWFIGVRHPSKNAGDFAIQNGFFTVVKASGIFLRSPDQRRIVFGVGVDANSFEASRINAIKDMKQIAADYARVIEETIEIIDTGSF